MKFGMVYLKTCGEKTKLAPICHRWPTGGRHPPLVVVQCPMLLNCILMLFCVLIPQVQGKVTVEFKFSLWRLDTMSSGGRHPSRYMRCILFAYCNSFKR